MWRTIAIISLIIFWVFVAIIFGRVFNNQKTVSSSQNNLPLNQTAASSKILTPALVASHNAANDCWIIISQKVYNVTSEINVHPGGANAVVPFCGQDGTAAFTTKSQTPPKNHSAFADSLLAGLYVGDLNQTMTSTPTNQNQPKNNLSTPPNPPSGSSSGQTGNIILSASEIAKHNITNDCWLIISNNVYNVTAYIGSHPGGTNAIAVYCGQDATIAFQTKGGAGSHSSYAYSLLGNYLLGPLNQTVTVGNWLKLKQKQ